MALAHRAPGASRMSSPAQAARERALASALLGRAREWQQAEARARRFAHGRSEDVAEAVRLAEDYRLLAHDLARARALMPASRTRAYLESAYAYTHATLH